MKLPLFYLNLYFSSAFCWSWKEFSTACVWDEGCVVFSPHKSHGIFRQEVKSMSHRLSHDPSRSTAQHSIAHSIYFFFRSLSWNTEIKDVYSVIGCLCMNLSRMCVNISQTNLFLFSWRRRSAADVLKKFDSDRFLQFIRVLCTVYTKHNNVDLFRSFIFALRKITRV